MNFIMSLNWWINKIYIKNERKTIKLINYQRKMLKRLKIIKRNKESMSSFNDFKDHAKFTVFEL